MGRFTSNRLAGASQIADAVDDAITSADLATNSDLTSGLAAKANSSDVTTALAAKANSSDVTTALAAKADASDLSTLEGTVTGLASDVTDLGSDVSGLASDVAGKADASDFTNLATEVSQGAGRVLTLAPTSVTGSGGAGTEVDTYNALTLPGGFSLNGGNKYKISGTILVRSGAGARIASVGVRDLIVMRQAAVPAWSDTPGDYSTNDMVLHTVDVGLGVMVQHLFMALQNNTAAHEPVFGGDARWQDLGGSALTPGVAYFEDVKDADETVDAEDNLSTFFSLSADLPSVGYNASTGALALVSKPKNGQSVTIEFDGTIAAVGAN